MEASYIQDFRLIHHPEILIAARNPAYGWRCFNADRSFSGSPPTGAGPARSGPLKYGRMELIRAYLGRVLRQDRHSVKWHSRVNPWVQG